MAVPSEAVREAEASMPCGEGPGIVKDDDRLEVNGSLGGDVADLVDLFHRSGEVGHHRGDGDIDRLAGADLPLVGIAEVQGELQLFGR